MELNRLLIIVVVLSMALTPLLNELGRTAARYIENSFEDSSPTDVCGLYTTHLEFKFEVSQSGDLTPVLVAFCKVFGSDIICGYIIF